MMRLAVVASLVLVSASAWAREGDACRVTADCNGGLHCIEGTCVGVENGKMREIPETPRQRASIWFGHGHGYVMPIVVIDALASIAAATCVAAGFSSRSGAWTIAALFPTTLAGPIVHLVDGRPAAAVVSFFAWASAPPTSIGAAALTGLGKWSQVTATVTGSIVAGSLAIALTALDAFMAREVKSASAASALQIVPAIAPTQNGLSVSVVGAF